MEHTQMLSVGIDIGTSTSQLIFSRITVENRAGYFSVPAVLIVGKDVVYQSPVYRTPLIDESLIDGEKLAAILEREYEAANVRTEQVETGAVIITGESARKENASLILDELSRFAGDFVVSTAGPDLESLIAGQGSGAQSYSSESGALVVNLDIGGGTTNLVLFDNGEAISQGCIDVGGRQIRLDEAGCITYISPSAALIAEDCHLSLQVGEKASEDKLERICTRMAELLEELLGIREETALLSDIRTDGSALFHRPEGRKIRYVFFSGGVADCIRRPDQDPFAFGDIGGLLGEAVRNSAIYREFKVVEAEETIHATVIGAGSYTTSISGSTIDYSDDIFPMKNVPVLKLTADEEQACWDGRQDLLEEKVRWFLTQCDAEQIVLAFDGKRDPGYRELKRLAETLAGGLSAVLAEGVPLIFVIREDIAKALGQILKRVLKGERAVVSLDSIRAGQNNYIDFGRPIMNGMVIPVVVKTLIFN